MGGMGGDGCLRGPAVPGMGVRVSACGGADPAEPPPQPCLSAGERGPLPGVSGEGDAVGYKPVGFGALPQARVGCLSPVTHPRLLLSPGTSWPSRPCRRCPPASPGAPIPSSSWSKHSSTATGRGHGDPCPAPGVQGGPAPVRESTSPGRGGGVQGGLGRAGEQTCAAEGQLCLPQICGV